LVDSSKSVAPIFFLCINHKGRNIHIMHTMPNRVRNRGAILCAPLLFPHQLFSFSSFHKGYKGRKQATPFRGYNASMFGHTGFALPIYKKQEN
jgi:hypothetical protein